MSDWQAMGEACPTASVTDPAEARNALTYHNTYVSRLKEAQQTSMRANALVLIPLLMLIPLQLTHVCLDLVSILHVCMIS